MKVEDMKPAVRAWLISTKEDAFCDRFGHIRFVGQESGNTYRFKVQANTVRREKRIEVCGRKEWLRIRTYSIKELYKLAKKNGYDGGGK